MQELETIAQNVKSKEDFIKFVEALIHDLKNNSSNWENESLEDYLEAIQSWIEDMNAYYINNGLPVPENINWKVFTDILMAAKMYE